MSAKRPWSVYANEAHGSYYISSHKTRELAEARARKFIITTRLLRGGPCPACDGTCAIVIPAGDWQGQ